MEQIIIELRSAEGGKDSKLLVEDLRDIYLKTARTNNFDYKVVNRDVKPKKPKEEKVKYQILKFIKTKL